MLEPYSHYQVADFVQDERFIRWVRRGDAEDTLFWERVQETFPFQRENIRKARQAMQGLALSSRPEVPVEDAIDIWRGIETELDREPGLDVTPKVSERQLADWWKWVAAASVALLLGWAGWNWMMNQPAVSPYEQLVEAAGTEMEEVTNRKDRILSLQLPDGSAVQLGKNSRLSYSRNFRGNQREVFLSGEAFFTVKRDPSRPFQVYANGLVTKVLGTSFKITAFEHDAQVLVAVRTGRVSVYQHQSAGKADPETKGLVLVPNQKAVFLREEQRLSRMLVDNPVALKPLVGEKPEVFTETPVTEIFHSIEQTYGVDIVFDEEVLKSCMLTTTLGNESLYQKLDIVCKGIGASYQVVDAQIIITSRGCE